MAQAVSPACALEIVGKARHGLGAARENAVQIAGGDFLKSERDALDARSAGLVHGVCGNFLRDVAANGNLARGIRAATSLARVAEDRFLYLLRLNSGALHGGLCGDYAHVGGGLRGERAAKFPNGRDRKSTRLNSSHVSE